MLHRLKLTNFRNYENQELVFSSGINVILGDNGQGKTNILEAIYYLSLLRSFRTQKVMELCNFGHGEFTLYGECASGSEFVSLGVSNGEKRRLSVNGVNCSLASSFISRMVCAAFIPEDMIIVKGSPSYRRRFLDILICQLSGEYLRALQQYTSALCQRNMMLKNPEKYNRNSITAYNHILVERGVAIELERRAYIQKINELLVRQSAEFYGNETAMSLKYMSGCGRLVQDIDNDDSETLKQKFNEILDKSYDNDCRYGMTKYGCHRSDFNCLLENKMLLHYGSEGQCRTAALALKLASLELLYKTLGNENITLVVDDVLGELDADKRNAFFRLLENAGQVIIACTQIPPELTTIQKIFHVKNGSVRN